MCGAVRLWMNMKLLAPLVSLIASSAMPASAQPSPIDTDEARRAAEHAAEDRAARQAEAIVGDARPGAPVQGPIPESETPCFAISNIVVNGAAHRRLRWVPKTLAGYRGRCLGAKGLDHLLSGLQASFLDRGLITTRAGLPEQDMKVGTLVVDVIPGMVSAAKTNGADKAFGWSVASPVDQGDIVSLRALEQGIEQMRRLPGREVAAELVPGDGVGESVIEVTRKGGRPFALSMALDNFAGRTVGRWQGSAQLAALDLLGANEMLSFSYNRRVDSPGLPADSRGLAANLSFPLGWWTLGISGSSNRYNQLVEGEVTSFDTLGRQRIVSGFVSRTLQRDQTSKSDIRASVSRRWGRNYIENVEIGIQRQDVTDLTIAFVDRRMLGRVRLDSEIGWRTGIGLFGAQNENGRPAALPTSRYDILTADIAAEVPVSHPVVKGWRLAFRGQVSDDQLYGSDSFSVGSPFTVRGFESDRAEIDRSGWYLRQELAGAVGKHLQPYLLLDMGRVKHGGDMLAGLGAGVRAQWRGFRFDGFAALPVSGAGSGTPRGPVFGLSAGWNL
jgi:hemolysin activation/secretion protein